MINFIICLPLFSLQIYKIHIIFRVFSASSWSLKNFLYLLLKDLPSHLLLSRCHHIRRIHRHTRLHTHRRIHRHTHHRLRLHTHHRLRLHIHRRTRLRTHRRIHRHTRLHTHRPALSLPCGFFCFFAGFSSSSSNGISYSS